MSQNSNPWDILEIARSSGQFIEKNFKIALAVFVVAILAVSAFVMKQKMDAGKEKEAFGELYSITKVYQDKKTNFEQAKVEPPKTDKKEAPKKDENLVKATGDMSKDYGDVVQQLESFIAKNKNLNATAEAALTLSEIYEEYKQPEKGAEIISQVLKDWSQTGLVTQVLQMRAGDLLASTNSCDKAVEYWQKIATGEGFMSEQAQLKLGVCFQEIGRLEEAKTWFTKLSEKSPNSTEGFNAKRYLRYLQFKGQLKPNEKASQNDKQAENKEKAS